MLQCRVIWNDVELLLDFDVQMSGHTMRTDDLLGMQTLISWQPASDLNPYRFPKVKMTGSFRLYTKVIQ